MRHLTRMLLRRRRKYAWGLRRFFDKCGTLYGGNGAVERESAHIRDELETILDWPDKRRAMTDAEAIKLAGTTIPSDGWPEPGPWPQPPALSSKPKTPQRQPLRLIGPVQCRHRKYWRIEDHSYESLTRLLQWPICDEHRALAMRQLRLLEGIKRDNERNATT